MSKQMAADSGNQSVVLAPGNQKEWMNATFASLDHTKDRAKRVQCVLNNLEQKEAARLRAQRAERRRQEAEAAEAVARQKEEEEAEKERIYREQQAEDLKLQQESVKETKRAGRAALKEATARFHQGIQAESEAKEKTELVKALKFSSGHLLSAVMDCQHETSKLYGVRCFVRSDNE